jgi:hypothetical protein
MRNERLLVSLLARRTAHVARGRRLRFLWHRRDVGILRDETSQLVWRLLASQGGLRKKKKKNVVLLELLFAIELLLGV